MTVVIRDAMPADEAALGEVFRKSSLSNDGDRPNLLAHPEFLEFSLGETPGGCTRVAIAAAGGLIVGFATCRADAGVAELDDLFVDPGWMRQGIGRALMEDAMVIARDHGIRRIEVTANEHARTFYEEVGFVVAGSAETRFGPALRMHLDVVP